MENMTEKYRLSIYTEIIELSKGKVYIVKSSLDDRIYIKKLLKVENYEVYKEIKELNISNIPKIYEAIILNDKLIVIEEYINGYSLKEMLDKSKVFGEEDVIKYMIDLIDILDGLHSSLLVIIHRDIKPSNIMISKDNVLKLIDFDISRVYKADKTTDTMILGTYGYAAPEQFGFNQTDARTDIYSIGATMNMLLTGKLPIEGLYKGNLSKVISKCIEVDSKKRFQNINELKNALLKEQKTPNKQYAYREAKLPGFKSNILLFKVIGAIWYFILAMAILGFFEEESISKDRIISIILVLFFFALTLLYGNYKNIRSKLPLINSPNIFKVIFGYILYTLALIIVLFIMFPT